MLLASAAILLASLSPAQAEDNADPVLDALAGEIDRAMSELSDQEAPPYHITAEITELWGVDMSAEEGAMQGYCPMHGRYLDVDLRIGAPELDSSHALRSGNDGRPRRHGRPVPLGEDELSIQRAVWREIERRYAEARERWAKVESDRQVLVEEEPSPDLAPVDAQQDLLPTADFEVDLEAWEETLRQASAVLAESQIVHDGAVKFSGQAETHWLATSEGTRLRHPVERYTLRVQVNTVADDGAALQLGRSWSARDPSSLPDRATVVSQTGDLEALIDQLRQAPEQEPYTGPALLTDQAAAVFFHEILGHRLEGHRLKRVDDAQTLRSMVGEQIMPRFLSLYDDPTVQRYADTDLNGTYTYDNQGVPAQRVALVKDGVLEGFLEGRSPSAQGIGSNGHGRRQPGYDPVTRQGNLIVEASTSVSNEELRTELIELAKAQGLEYALLIDGIQGGVTFTGRKIPNAFSVDVQLAYRIYTDGRPDELVRGVDLIGTPLVTLSRIVRAGEVHEVFNGTCGAESGGVPVAAISPALLISQMETQRKAKGQSMPPLLPPPGSVSEVQP